MLSVHTEYPHPLPGFLQAAVIVERMIHQNIQNRKILLLPDTASTLRLKHSLAAEPDEIKGDKRRLFPLQKMQHLIHRLIHPLIVDKAGLVSVPLQFQCNLFGKISQRLHRIFYENDFSDLCHSVLPLSG